MEARLFPFLGRSCIEKGAAFFAADLINTLKRFRFFYYRSSFVSLLYSTTYRVSTVSQSLYRESLFYPKSDFSLFTVFYGLPDPCQKSTVIISQFWAKSQNPASNLHRWGYNLSSFPRGKRCRLSCRNSQYPSGRTRCTCSRRSPCSAGLRR